MLKESAPELRPIIVNRSRYENVPEDLRELGDDISRIAEEVYPDVLSINWHGSIPRGDFVPNESDADITIFIKNDFEDGHFEKREKLLDEILPKWKERGVAKLDVMAVPQSEFHDKFRRSTLFACESDGIYLPRYRELDFAYILPKTNLELVTLLNRPLELWARDAQDEIKDLTEEQIYKQVWKRTYRGVYGLAILSGAPYEQNWHIYPRLIEKYTPEYARLMANLLQPNLTLEQILETTNTVVAQLKSQGIAFKNKW